LEADADVKSDISIKIRCIVFADPADTGNPEVIRKRLIGP
jgi:hypothetical protein